MSYPSPACGLHTANGHKPRVAVVDGNPASARVTALLVEQFGCDVVKAASGEAALALLNRIDPVDLMLIDLAIPDMDGVVAALLIREIGGHRDLPIVPVTSPRDDLNSARSRAVGFSGAVMKPYSPRQLYAVIDAALTHMPAALADA